MASPHSEQSVSHMLEVSGPVGKPTLNSTKASSSCTPVEESVDHDTIEDLEKRTREMELHSEQVKCTNSTEETHPHTHAQQQSCTAEDEVSSNITAGSERRIESNSNAVLLDADHPAESPPLLSCGTSTDSDGRIREERFWVPLDRVGALIGMRGNTIKSIQERSGTFILIRNDCVNRNSNEKLLTITGSESGIESARALVLDQLQMEPRRSLQPHPPSPSTPGAPLPASSSNLSPYVMRSITSHQQQQRSRTVHIPNLCVGICIGKSGETIRDLQERSGAHIKIAPCSSSKDWNAERPVSISGTPQSIELAHTLLNDIVNEALQGLRRTQEMSAQKLASGTPLASDVGSACHEARDEAGEKSGDEPLAETKETQEIERGNEHAAVSVTDSGERSLMFGGVVDAEYFEHYGSVPPPRRVDGGLGEHATYPTSSLAVTVLVPNDKVGLVIGRGGASIRELQRKSGARIVVAREVDANRRENTRPVTITGPASFIETAKALITEKIEDSGKRSSESSLVQSTQQSQPKAQVQQRQQPATPSYAYYADHSPEELLFLQQQQQHQQNQARAMMLPMYGGPMPFLQSMPPQAMLHQQAQPGMFGYTSLPYPMVFDPMIQQQQQPPPPQPQQAPPTNLYASSSSAYTGEHPPTYETPDSNTSGAAPPQATSPRHNSTT